jgi:hypothetical protein
MATNRIDILDPALLRPGRIDRKIEFPPPNEEARLDILKIHSRKMNLTRGINLRKIAELMPGASGAEVKVKKNAIYYHHYYVTAQIVVLASSIFLSHIFPSDTSLFHPAVPVLSHLLSHYLSKCSLASLLVDPHIYFYF